jgi:hypothetical protein
MLQTPNLTLPYIDVNQAQREVVYNNAVRGLDALVQLAVLDRDLASPPGAPTDGQRWIVAASPSGAWAGHAQHIAAWQDGAWRFYVPKVGWLAYVVDEGALLAWSGSAWVDAMAILTTLQNMVLLGIGTTADATNPLSAKLNNTLWTAKTIAEGGDGNLRYKMSKESAAKTLSLLMQTNFSGRAEIGLTGDDDLHFKVSPDGSAWTDALLIDRTTGATRVTQTLSLLGGQIAFPATQNASSDPNTLDDYEEGTWTPGVSFGGGTTGITYSVQACTYCKIGSVVWIQGYMLLTNKGSATGNAAVTGLPFTASGTANNYTSSSCRVSAMVTAGPYFLQINPSGTTALVTVQSGGSVANATQADFTNGAEFVIGMHYRASA